MTDFLTALTALALSPLTIYLAAIAILVATGAAYMSWRDRQS